jgi:hypothetical protein
MRLELNEIPDLARFFAKRFPTASERQDLARAARVPFAEPKHRAAHVSWEKLLRDGQSRRRLHLLAHAAARAQPEDPNLLSVCGVLTGSKRPGHVPLYQRPGAGPAAGLMVLAIAGIATAMTLQSDPDLGATHTDLDALAALTAEPTPAAVPTASDGALPALVSIEGAGGADADAKPWKSDNPLDAAKNATVAKRPAKPAAKKTTRPAHHHGRCTLKEGGIVGYWYAGTTAPGDAGGIISVANSVNVRADYPDTHNGFDSRAPVRCTLKEGDRLRLTDAPIAVPGAAYWVPLHSDDLIVD